MAEQLRPGLQSSPPDHPLKLGPQVDASIAATGDDVLTAGLGRLKGFAQVRQQFGEDRDQPRILAFVGFGLGTANRHPVVFPIHVTPA
jgi:hypothetical protein